ncbi:MAG: YbhB/YbcL family Raf kinase inhibitor-like protein [Patescibacteria group bacterium]
MKTILAIILIFLAVASGVYFLNKKSSRNNILIDQTESERERIDMEAGENVSSVKANNNNNKFKDINMKLTSAAFRNNEYIPSKYTCDGEDKNPPLFISGAPKEAKSLVLIVDDPDAPNGDWVHWTVFNIPPDVKEINENSVPHGAVQGRTDFAKPGYGGPCPHNGIHHYQFKLYAIDAILNLQASAGKKDIEKFMNGHILAEDLLVGLYKRK